MADGLIGHTGFIGSNLVRQRGFDDSYHSRNIEEIAGRSYDVLVCCGAPAAKWRANENPESDRTSLQRLMAALRGVAARQFILISTIDVFPLPIAVDETSPIDLAKAHAYGRHRRELELFVQDRFDALIVRLPGLFGAGLKKNVIFDFLHDNLVSGIHADSLYQFYGLDSLWCDIEQCMAFDLRLVNFATEPVSVSEVADSAFGFEFTNRPASPPARYDVRSIHAGRLGGRDGYTRDKASVLAELGRFVSLYRNAMR